MIYILRTRKSGCLIHKTQCAMCVYVPEKERETEQTESRMRQLKSFSITGQFWTHSDIAQDLATLQERHTPITVAKALGGNNITSPWSVNRQNPLPHRPGRGSELVFTQGLLLKMKMKTGKRSQEMNNAWEKKSTFFCGPMLKSIII